MAKKKNTTNECTLQELNRERIQKFLFFGGIMDSDNIANGNNSVSGRRDDPYKMDEFGSQTFQIKVQNMRSS